MPRILFVCPDLNTPAGGIKQIYRQVEILNKNGFEAYVLHNQEPFKVIWFKNYVPIVWDYRVGEIDKPKNLGFTRQIINAFKTIAKGNISFKKTNKTKIKFNYDDIVVLPEFYGKALDYVFPKQSVVLYNQNCYYSFRGYNFKEQNKDSIYLQERLKAVIVASVDAMKYIGLFMGNKPLFRVKYGIDNAVFSYEKNKKKQIAFMPRKLREDSVQILNILHQKNLLNDWSVKPIDGLNEQEVAEVLKESAIFLSFNHREGFGMPPAEAMACGCIVVGYAGQGGKEVLRPEFSYPIPDRDIVSFVKVLSDILMNYNTNSEKLIQKSIMASEFILSNYSMQQEEQTIVNTWKEILPLKQ